MIYFSIKNFKKHVIPALCPAAALREGGKAGIQRPFVSLFLCFFVFLLSFSVVFAFNNPPANPPTGSGAIVTDSSNRVGIGTVAPTQKLTVAGNVDIGTNYLSFGGNVVTDSTAGINWHTTGAPVGNFSIYRSAGAWSAPNYQQLVLDWPTGMILNPGTLYGKSYVDIQGGGLRVTAGNVGIGTISPGGPLHINAPVTTGTTVGQKDARVLLQNNSVTVNAGGEIVLGVAADSATGRYAAIGTDIKTNSSGNAIGDVYIATKAAITDTALTRRLVVTSGGNVGIGTAAPTQKLDVQGGSINTSASVMTGGVARISNTGVVGSAGANATWNGAAVGAIYGGTSQTTYAAGDLLYASAANTLAKRAIGTAGQVLTVSGGVPTWAAASGITSLNGLVTSAQTFANDTNVTISSSLSTHTLGWSGMLAPARGGTGLNTGLSSGVPSIIGGTWSVNAQLPIALGGTNAITAAAARTNLAAAASGANSDITSITGLTTALSATLGGTGATTLPANNVLLGNGTAAVQSVAPGALGNILTSNGTTWTSATPSGTTATREIVRGVYPTWTGGAGYGWAYCSVGKKVVGGGCKRGNSVAEIYNCRLAQSHPTYVGFVGDADPRYNQEGWYCEWRDRDQTSLCGGGSESGYVICE